MDPLVLGLAAFSAACFLTFAVWPRSSPTGQLEVVRASEDDPPAAVIGKAAAPAHEHAIAATRVLRSPALLFCHRTATWQLGRLSVPVADPLETDWQRERLPP